MADITVRRTIRSRAILSEAIITQVVAAVLKREKIDGSVSVHLVGTKKIASLNAMYRGIDAPTDVLSFETGEQWGNEVDLGDIFLCQPYIIDQAKRFDVPLREEARRMLIHGVLHLLGYDHETEREAAQMFAKQEAYLTHHS